MAAINFSQEVHRLYIIGGVHGNQAAFSAFRAKTQANPAPIICTGDLAAYCADGASVCKTARHLANAWFIRGNCERTIAADDEDCGCGFIAGSQCDILSASWHKHARDTISNDEKKWMGNLPPMQIIIFANRRFAVIHASADSDNEFIFASTPATRKEQIAKQLNVNGIICGHSGIPFTQNINGILWHNSGALGMPANDGTPRVWYAQWTIEDEHILIEHIALSYDIATSQQAIRDSGMPDDYAKTLQSGIWPSDSILPPTERQQQGIPLNLPPMQF